VPEILICSGETESQCVQVSLTVAVWVTSLNRCLMRPVSILCGAMLVLPRVRSARLAERGPTTPDNALGCGRRARPSPDWPWWCSSYAGFSTTIPKGAAYKRRWSFPRKASAKLKETRHRDCRKRAVNSIQLRYIASCKPCCLLLAAVHLVLSGGENYRPAHPLG
jgi:hypothetical protein